MFHDFSLVVVRWSFGTFCDLETGVGVLFATVGREADQRPAHWPMAPPVKAFLRPSLTGAGLLVAQVVQGQ
jgi:hypothetical protein